MPSFAKTGFYIAFARAVNFVTGRVAIKYFPAVFADKLFGIFGIQNSVLIIPLVPA